MKFDGYRCQLHKAGDDVVIFSKNGREFTSRFPGIRDAVLTLPCKSAVIDGEVVACKEDGTPDFRALHTGNYTQEILCVWAFDLMELNGEDLRPFALVARCWRPRRRRRQRTEEQAMANLVVALVAEGASQSRLQPAAV